MPSRKHPWPLARKVLQTDSHSASVVGGFRPYLSNMSLLIHMMPAPTLAHWAATSRSFTVKAVTPPS